MGRPATQHEERKSQIVTAALDVFASKGYDGTTNHLIAEAAGLNSAALIYHYFPSKTDLFKACLERITALGDLKHDLATGQDKPPEVYLRKVAMSYLKTLSGNPVNHLFLMVLAAAQSHPELMPILMGKLSEVIFFPLLSYFTRMSAEGRLRQISPVTAAQELLGPLMLRAIAGALFEASLPFVFQDDEEFINTHIQVFLDGLRRRGIEDAPGS
jgi:AcrR family transcriptional regulator